MDILVLKEEFGELILSGIKTWEVRGTPTNKRGRIQIAYSKTGKIYGEADLVDCFPLTEKLWKWNKRKHRNYCQFSECSYKTPYAWVIKHAEKYKEPIEYEHPYGAVVWVKGKDESNNINQNIEN